MFKKYGARKEIKERLSSFDGWEKDSALAHQRVKYIEGHLKHIRLLSPETKQALYEELAETHIQPINRLYRWGKDPSPPFRWIDQDVTAAKKGIDDYLNAGNLNKAKWLLSNLEHYTGHAETKYRQIIQNREKGKKRGVKGKLEKAIATASIIGVLGGIFFLSSNITGNAIADITTKTTSFIGAGLLIVGLVAGFFWLKSKKK